MEQAGMVDALEEIHRLLKPEGVLIDIHPIAEASSVELHQGGKFDLIDHWSVSQWCTDYQHADKALAESVARGLFTLERENVFDSLTHYSTVAEMYTDLKENVEKYARDAPSADKAMPSIEALAARAEEIIGDDHIGTELIVHERAHISRLRPTSWVAIPNH